MARWGWFVSKVALMVGLAWLMVGCERTPAQAPPAAGIAGEWDGMVGRLHLVLTFEAKDGGWTGKLVSVDQGNTTVAIDAVTFGEGKLKLGLAGIGAAYAGTLDAAGTSFTGTWSQGGAALPLILHRPGIVPQTAAFTLKPRTIGSVAMVPCRTVDGNTEGLCGTYSVWENRALKSGRKLALKIMVLPALNGAAASDAFVPLAGGPGQSAIEAFPLTGYTAEVRKTRDVVLVDQRGVGGSAALDCSLRDMTSAQQVMGEEISRERLDTCVKQLQKTADLTQYTTSIFADDLDEIRAALGYDRIDVLGGSYGTRAAMVYLRQHPKHVRTIALEGVAPPEYRVPLNFPHAIQSSIDGIIAQCEAGCGLSQGLSGAEDGICNCFGSTGEDACAGGAFGGWNEAEGHVDEGNVCVGPAAGAVFSGCDCLVSADGAESVQRRLRNVCHGDHADQAGLRQDDQSGYELVGCVFGGPAGMTEAMIERETAGTYIGDYDVKRYENYCSVWPHGTAPADFHAAIIRMCRLC